MQRTLRILERFDHDESGAIAVIFALVLMPLLFVVGIAIDYGRASSFERSMQQALDAAVLDGARELAKTGKARKALRAVQARFAVSDAGKAGVSPNVNVNDRSGRISATAKTEFAMSFMALAGYSTVPIDAEAVASAGIRPKANSRAPQRRAQGAGRKIPKLSERQIRDLIARVQQTCNKIQQMGYGGKIKQCWPVYSGTFEQKLRQQLASKDGDPSKVLPGGVRLVQ